MKKAEGFYIPARDSFELIHSPSERAAIAQLVDLYSLPQTRESIIHNLQVLADAAPVVSGSRCCGP
jgi:hypothetical protein